MAEETGKTKATAQAASGSTPTQPVIVILGQTASGKSALGIKAALEFGGEIIAADSRTIYKHMDIGTAKPTPEDQALVPHYGLDLIEPTEYFSAAAFKDYATKQVSEIHKRAKIPFIVGGTGLYIDGYAYDFSFAAEADRSQRKELESLNLDELQKRATELGIEETEIDFKNHRHLSRAVERGNASTTRKPVPQNVLLIGLKIEREQLLDRISQRVNSMFEQGFIDEVQTLIDRYGSSAHGLLTPGYKAGSRYVSGEISQEEAKEEFKRSDKYLAKRQLTWFKRNPDINWVHSEQEAMEKIRAFLLRFDTIET